MKKSTTFISKSIKTPQAAEDKDKETIKIIIDLIKQQRLSKAMPSAKDIQTIRDLAAKYLGNIEFEKLLEIAEESFKQAQEIAGKELFHSLEKIGHSYTEEQYLDLLQKENSYFDSEKTQKRHQLINKMMSGSHINDDDKSGNSISSEQFVHFIQDISSDEEKIKAQEASELLSYDLNRIKEKESLATPLTKLEESRKEQIFERLDKRAQELLYDSRFKNHQATYAKENSKNLSETTIEEVVKAIGNIVIGEVIEIYPKLKEAFKGKEEKLAALVFHNPDAIDKHHNNLEELKIEADKAHKQQKEFEKEKSEQLQEKEVYKSSQKVKTKVEEQVQRTSITEYKENIDSTRMEVKTKDFSSLAALKAKKSIAPKLPEPLTKHINHDVTSSNLTPPKPISKHKGFLKE